MSVIPIACFLSPNVEFPHRFCNLKNWHLWYEASLQNELINGHSGLSIQYMYMRYTAVIQTN